MKSNESRSTRRLFKIKFQKEGGYLSVEGEEYLDQLEDKLRELGLDPMNLVFSGFDGAIAKNTRTTPRYDHIFAVNDAGWREGLKEDGRNPAQYADLDVPCIGVYDKHLLREAQDHSTDQHQHLIESRLATPGIPEENIPSEEIGHFSTEATVREVENDDRIKIDDIVPGKPLADLPNDYPVKELVIHIDYPNGSPTDALLGLVFLVD